MVYGRYMADISILTMVYKTNVLNLGGTSLWVWDGLGLRKILRLWNIHLVNRD